MGIASTLIIVRTALGIQIDNEQSFRITVLKEDSGSGESRGMLESVLDIRRHEPAVEDEERRDQEDPFLRNTAMGLDPLQDFLYLAPQTDKSTFRDIFNAQIGPYAQANAEIGVLSVSTALIPGAPRA
ncbi:hypothetical protein PQX77_013902 [Marasmius sp. AFHP31]|nr:hypothetical protein PQX77_013902 [Marasmius sp. AFHP31]